MRKFRYNCECGYGQQEEFNICPNCTAKEKAELTASAVEAYLHIDILHAVVKSGDLATAGMIIADWEDGQC
jgi:hypothetical protein